MHAARVAIALGTFALLATATACRRSEDSAAKPTGGQEFTLVYSSNLDGEIEPCG